MRAHLVRLAMAALTLSGTHAANAQLTLAGVDQAPNVHIVKRVLDEAYARSGRSFALELYPPARSVRRANAGTVDGELFRLAGLEADFPNLVRVPVPVDRIEAVAFTDGKPFKVRGWESLKPYRVGIRRGIRFAEQGVASVDGLSVQAVASVDQLFGLLEHGRVDVIVLSRLSGLSALAERPRSVVTPLEPPLQTYPVYHYLHRRNEALVPALTEALTTMQRDGRIRQIRRDYIRAHFGSAPAPAKRSPG